MEGLVQKKGKSKLGRWNERHMKFEVLAPGEGNVYSKNNAASSSRKTSSLARWFDLPDVEGHENRIELYMKAGSDETDCAFKLETPALKSKWCFALAAFKPAADNTGHPKYEAKDNAANASFIAAIDQQIAADGKAADNDFAKDYAPTAAATESTANTNSVLQFHGYAGADAEDDDDSGAAAPAPAPVAVTKAPTFMEKAAASVAGAGAAIKNTVNADSAASPDTDGGAGGDPLAATGDVGDLDHLRVSCAGASTVVTWRAARRAHGPGRLFETAL
jgi:hypothetical protein